MACDNSIDRYDQPENLIAEDTMVSIMTDIMKAEGYTQIKGYQVNQFSDALIKTADSIFKAHNVTSDQYEVSLKYYASYQDKMDQIYGAVLEDVSKELGEVQAR